jgi:hypothetical protein
MAFQCGQNLSSITATLSLPNPAPAVDACPGGYRPDARITLQDNRGDQTNAIDAAWVTYAGSNKPYLQVRRTFGAQTIANGAHPSTAWTPALDQNNQPVTPQPITLIDSPTGSMTGADKGLIANGVEPDKADLTGRPSVNLAIRHSDKDGGEWGVDVDGQEVGYYLDSTWPSGFSPQRVEWSGEVVSNPTPASLNCPIADGKATCTATGTGTPAGNAATFSDMDVQADPPASLAERDLYVTNPTQFQSDSYTGPADGAQKLNADNFKYGSTGSCPTSTGPPTLPPVAAAPAAPAPAPVALPPAPAPAAPAPAPVARRPRTPPAPAAAPLAMRSSVSTNNDFDNDSDDHSHHHHHH